MPAQLCLETRTGGKTRQMQMRREDLGARRSQWISAGTIRISQAIRISNAIRISHEFTGVNSDCQSIREARRCSGEKSPQARTAE